MSERPPHARQPQPEPEPNADSGGIAGIDVPTPSTRTIIILAVVAVALYLLLRSSGSSDDDSATSDDSSDNGEEAIEVPDDIAEQFEGVDEDDEVEIRVPLNPDSELDKDKAVIEALKEDGTIEVGD